MAKTISKKVDVEISVCGTKNDFCSGDCAFRSFYVEAFCKRYKKELTYKDYWDEKTRKRIINKGLKDTGERFKYLTVYFDRCDECIREFGK